MQMEETTDSTIALHSANTVSTTEIAIAGRVSIAVTIGMRRPITIAVIGIRAVLIVLIGRAKRGITRMCRSIVTIGVS
jgi:hypothetical protein